MREGARTSGLTGISCLAGSSWTGMRRSRLGSSVRRLALGLGLALLPLVLAAGGSAYAQNPPPSKARVMRGASSTPAVTPRRIDLDLRELKRPKFSAWRAGDPIKVIPKRTHPTPEHLANLARLKPRAPSLDPLLALQAAAPTQRVFTAPIVNFAGQGFTGAFPPDTVGDVGQNFYIQMVNGTGGAPVTIYNKSDGTVAAGPFEIDSFGSGDCAVGSGDPIVLYDHLAERWLLTEFSNSGNKLCAYVSQTSDPVTGGWFAYEFQAPAFPDYPKYAVWPDGYYIGTNESPPAVYAIDRIQMLLGAAATMQRFTASPLAGFGFQMLIPADLDGGTVPPAGTPAYFLRHRDDESHNPPGTAEDFLEIFEFHADFATPANSTFTGPTLIPVAEFDSNLCGLTSFSCVPQPSPGTPLDPLREVVMWRAVYRNFGTHETLLGNFVTDVDGSDHHGIRWFELQKTTGPSFSLFQEGTYAPDSNHRWMGSIAMDGAQNIALGYSVSSTSVNPGIRYTGRLQSDPAGTLPQPETTLQAGLSVQVGVDRWGDYSSMSVDPSDDCSFWFTTEYVRADGNWDTRIGSFKFDACSATPEIQVVATNLAQHVCAPNDLADIGLTVTGLNGFADDVTLSYVGLPTGFSGVFSTNPVTLPGTSTATVSVDGSASIGGQQFLIRGSGTGVNDSDHTVDVEVSSAIPGTAALSAPANAATLVSTTPTFSWGAATQAVSYTLEVDDDPAFGSIDFTASPNSTSATLGTALSPATQYFWRVRATNACGTGVDSAAFSFTTAVDLCSSPAVAIPDNDLTGVTDAQVVGITDLLDDLDVSVEISHSWVGDLLVTVTHVDTGTSAVLLDRPGSAPSTPFGCSGNNVDANFDDEATNPAEDECAAGSPAIAGNLTPTGALSAFDGESFAGTWNLTAVDNEGADTGILQSWCLNATTLTKVCGDGVVAGAGECDDGNVLPGDGCSEICAIEPGWLCSGQPSSCELDTDGDGLGNSSDPDDDNDGVADGSDVDSLNPDLCIDSDADDCDDCAIGTDGFGVLSDATPENDGLDTDADGACNAGDSDDDDDGIADFIEVGIGFDPLLVDSDSNGTADGFDLIQVVLLCVTQPAPALGPLGIALAVGLLAGLGMSRTGRKRPGS